MEQHYEAINRAWQEAGLAGRRVLDTPGWQTAVEAVRRYCESVGWSAPPVGPVARDTWSHWLHILSHTLHEGGHGRAHADLEGQLQSLALDALLLAKGAQT